MKERKPNKRNQPVVIALSGVNGAGKTAVLQRFAADLRKQGVKMSSSSGGTPRDNRYRCVFKGKNLVICTGGDDERVLRGNFAFARNKPGYDVLVTATRSYVGVQAVDVLLKESAKDGAYPHFITKMRANGAVRAIAEQQAVDDILTLIP